MKLEQSVFDEIPNSYRWAAYSPSGLVKVFEECPHINGKRWVSNSGSRRVVHGFDVPACAGDEPYPGWRDSLTERTAFYAKGPVYYAPDPLPVPQAPEPVYYAPPGGYVHAEPLPIVGPTIAQLQEQGHLPDPDSIPVADLPAPDYYEYTRMLLECERLNFKLAKARRNMARLVENGELSIDQFNEVFGK